MRTFVLGDIHGAFKALRQCFEQSGFNKEEDRLIVLGDVCDGWPEVRECVDELLTIKHCDYILGNHDAWSLAWAKDGACDELWLSQGGANTVRSYADGMPAQHVSFFESARFYIEDGQRLFVHGGFNPNQPISKQDPASLMWDRELLVVALERHEEKAGFKFADYEDIFIGHTPTLRFGSLEPIHACNVWAMDTGAGWSGRLTIMDATTKKFWQSDLVPELYPNETGRSRL